MATVDYKRTCIPGVNNFPWKGRGLGHVTHVKFLTFFHISGMDEATIFKFGKWIDYGKSHCRVENFPWKGHGLGHVALLIILNSIQYFWNELQVQWSYFTYHFNSCNSLLPNDLGKGKWIHIASLL